MGNAKSCHIALHYQLVNPHVMVRERIVKLAHDGGLGTVTSNGTDCYRRSRWERTKLTSPVMLQHP